MLSRDRWLANQSGIDLPFWANTVTLSEVRVGASISANVVIVVGFLADDVENKHDIYLKEKYHCPS